MKTISDNGPCQHEFESNTNCRQLDSPTLQIITGEIGCFDWWPFETILIFVRSVLFEVHDKIFNISLYLKQKQLQMIIACVELTN